MIQEHIESYFKNLFQNTISIAQPDSLSVKAGLIADEI